MGIIGIVGMKFGVNVGVTVVNPIPPRVVVVADEPSLKLVKEKLPIRVVILLRPVE